MSAEPHILVLNYVPGDAHGHGGSHRAYQLVHELGELVGPARVRALCGRAVEERRGRRRLARWQYWPGRRVYLRLRHEWRRLRQNPLRVWGSTSFSPHTFTTPEFVAACRALAEGPGRPDVCVAEHPGYHPVAAVMRGLGIPTIVCPQNLESLYDVPDLDQFPRVMRPLAFDLAREIEALRQFNHRLFISSAEAGLVGGLGLTADHHPYRPVGAILEQGFDLRARRARHARRDHFLLLGSASNPATFRSMGWLLGHAARQGLPPGAQIQVAGYHVDRLAPGPQPSPGVWLHGRVSQLTLEDLLLRAHAVLVPQRLGFGALTRLSELSCAGVPVICARHPTFTMDLPPGVHVAGDGWEAWQDAMTRVLRGEWSGADVASYEAWDARQRRAMPELVRSLLNGKAPS